MLFYPPATADHIAAMVTEIPNTTQGLLILLGFSGAFRCSKLVAPTLNKGDIFVISDLSLFRTFLV